MEHFDIETIPDRILGMQKLEALFNQQGYLICQSSGERIYNFEEVVTIFIPLSPERDQVMAVQREQTTEFLKSWLLALQ